MKRILLIYLQLIVISIFLSGCLKMEDALVRTIMDWEISASGLIQKKVNVGGIDFVYFEGGQGPETIVLLHGFAADKSNWIRFVRTLVSEYKVIIPDQAGHGESGGTLKDFYTISSQANRLEQFISKIVVEKFKTKLNNKKKVYLSISLGWIILIGYLTWWNGLKSVSLDKSFRWDEWFWFGIIPATIPYVFYFIWKTPFIEEEKNKEEEQH